MMSYNDPAELVEAFFRAFNEGDIEAIVALFEPDVVMIPQPGQTVTGIQALRESMQAFLAMQPTLTPEKPEVVTAGDVALVKWTLKGKGPDGQPVEMAGTTTDVLRRQADGRWLYLIDNPWGPALLG
jgi:uncharacterized protein (TIGR02246 family)